MARRTRLMLTSRRSPCGPYAGPIRRLRSCRSLRAAIEREAGRARQDPALLQAYRALRLNLGTSDVVEALLLEADSWARAEGDTEAAGPLVLGIDLGGTAAMSAAVGYWPMSGRLESLACFPEEPGLTERGLRDGVGSLYVQMAQRSELVLGGQFVADVRTLLAEALTRWGRPVAIAADRYREGELREALASANFPTAALVLRGQGYRDGAEDVRAFRSAVLDGRVTALPSLLLRSAMASARVITDASANQKLAKASEGGRRLRSRDDAAAASILAVAVGSRGYTRTAAPARHAVAG